MSRVSVILFPVLPPTSRGSTPEKRFIVFEAINEDFKEIFVGISALTMNETIERIKSEPPAEIQHWGGSEVSYRSVEFDLPEPAAKDFVRRYVKSLPGRYRYLSGKN